MIWVLERKTGKIKEGKGLGLYWVCGVFI